MLTAWAYYQGCRYGFVRHQLPYCLLSFNQACDPLLIFQVWVFHKQLVTGFEEIYVEAAGREESPLPELKEFQ